MERALPEFQGFLANFPGFDLSDVPAMRAALAANPPPTPADPDWAKEIRQQEVWIDGQKGRRIRVLIYHSAKPESTKSLLWIHGGGFCLAAPEADRLGNLYLARSGITIVSPAYNLAPENPYPGPLEDVLSTWNWMTQSSEASDLRIGKKGAVAGCSAGACLAACLALQLVGTPNAPLAVLLDSPVTSGEIDKWPSMKDDHPLRKYHIWSPQNTKDSMKHHNADPSTYPLAASNEVISQLPPHYIGIPELDCLADQGLAYCAKLQENAVPLGVSLFKGAIHGFIVFMPTTPLTTTAYERYEEFLRTAY